MNDKQLLYKADRLGLALGAAVLALLTLLAGDASAQGVAVPASVTPPVVVTAPIVLPDEYIYYPAYGIYYNGRRQQYFSLRGKSWLIGAQPFGVEINTLRATPFVNVDFHDSPARHHEEILKRYPANWHPAAAQQPQHAPPEIIKK